MKENETIIVVLFKTEDDKNRAYDLFGNRQKPKNTIFNILN